MGVALKLVMALGSVSGGEKRANALFHEYADLAAVGTIADVMKLLGENRTIVRVGLKHLKKTRRRGLYALMVEAGTLSRAINSTTVGVDICRQLKSRYPSLRVLVFTGEVLNERLWVEVLAAGADGIILKTGNLLERDDVMLVMHGRRYVFNEPFLEKVIARFRKVVCTESAQADAMLQYDIDEYDERFLRHLALGYTKEMIASLRQMPFGTKSLEKRQADLISRLFPPQERNGVNAVRLAVRAIQLHILDVDHLVADED